LPLSLNLYWPRQEEVGNLFRRLDPLLFEECGQNPYLMLQRISPWRLEEVAKEDFFVNRLSWLWQEYQDYLNSSSTHCWPEPSQHIAYFSAEFGLSQALPMYAGGLGFLAGDHLKSASDLGLPLVGVSLIYRNGYFRQSLDKQGWQQELYPDYDCYQLPLEEVLLLEGIPLTVTVEFPERFVRVKLWRVRVGRLFLYLLDTDLEENWMPDRGITDKLSGGDLEKRLQQEIILGIGGMRALAALNLKI